MVFSKLRSFVCGFLNFQVDDLICLADECLAWGQHIYFLCVAYDFLDKLYQCNNGCKEASKYPITRKNDKEILYGELGETQEAKDCFEKQLKIAKEVGDKYGEASAYGSLGILHQHLCKYEEAIEYHKKQLSVALKIEDQNPGGIVDGCLENTCNLQRKYLEALGKCEEGNAHSNLGKAYYSLEKHQEAIKHYKKHLEITLKTGDKYGEGSVYVCLGALYLTLVGNFQKAIKYYEKALHIAVEICANEELEMLACLGLGESYDCLEKCNEAIIHYEKHLKIAVNIGDTDSEGVSYCHLGNAYQSLGKYTKAFGYHEKQLNLAIKMGDKDSEGTSYKNIGKTYLLLGKYQKAVEYSEKSLCIAIDRGDTNAQGKVYGNLGVACQYLCRYPDAIECHRNELTIATEIGDKNMEKTACGNLGVIYHALGKYQDAIKYHEISLKIAIEKDDKRSESTVYENLGAVYNTKGKYYDAILYRERALKISQEIGDNIGEASIYGNLAETHAVLGKFEESIKYSEKQLDIAVKNRDKKAEAIAYGNFGNVCYFLGKYQEAIDYHSKQLTVASEIGDKKNKSVACGSIANTYMSLGKYVDAMTYDERRLMISKEIGDRRDVGRAYIALGNTNRSLGEHQKAIELIIKGLEIVRDLGDKDGEANAYTNLGVTSLSLALSYRETDDQVKYHFHMKKSEDYLREAIRCYEWVFDQLQQQDALKISIVDTFSYLYRMLTAVLIETQQINEALLVSESGRASALRDILIIKYNLARNDGSKDDKPKIAAKYNFCIMFFTLFTYFSEVAYWVIAPKKHVFFNRSKIEGVKHEVSSRTHDKEQMETFITKVVIKAYDKMNVRQGVHCEDRSFGSFEGVCNHVDARKEAQEKTSERKEKDNSDNPTTSIRCIPEEDLYDQDDTNPLERLFEVIAPAVNYITEDEVVIIPDGPLNMVPFAALRDPHTGLFFSEIKRIRLAPSLTAMEVWRKCAVEHHSQKGALIVGGPDIGEVMFRGDKVSFSSLPYAKYEAERISEVLGVEPLIGSQATKEVVIQRLREGLAVIHFAAHGSENGEILLAPSVSSASKSTPEEEQYILTVKEVQETGIRAQLVVLSCCHSGRGEIKAEGVVGMSRAFLAAGARAVVASLWAIEDEATKVFMLHFYSHLKRGESASASLQQSMNDMRETERYREPKYWASFFLIGDDVKICL